MIKEIDLTNINAMTNLVNMSEIIFFCETVNKQLGDYISNLRLTKNRKAISDLKMFTTVVRDWLEKHKEQFCSPLIKIHIDVIVLKVHTSLKGDKTFLYVDTSQEQLNKLSVINVIAILHSSIHHAFRKIKQNLTTINQQDCERVLTRILYLGIRLQRNLSKSPEPDIYEIGFYSRIFTVVEITKTIKNENS